MNLYRLNPNYFVGSRLEIPIPPVIGSALISAGAGLFGSLFGNNAKQKEIENTNRTNLFINKQQLEEARRAATVSFQRQNYLIDKQNAYNTYENQRNLMEKAGYNPNLMASGSAGTAVSSGSTNAPQQQIPSPIPMQAASNLSYAQDFANIASTMADARLKEAQARKTDTENDYLPSLNDAQINVLVADYNQRFNDVRLFDATFGDRVKSFNLQNELSESQRDNFKAQMFSTMKHLNIDQRTFEYNMANVWPATVKQIQAATGLSYANSLAAFANAAYSYALKSKTDSETAFNRSVLLSPRYKEAFIDKAVEEARLIGNKADSEKEGLPYIIDYGADVTTNYDFGAYSQSSTSHKRGFYNPKGKKASTFTIGRSRYNDASATFDAAVNIATRGTGRSSKGSRRR